MEIKILNSSDELGRVAAEYSASVINESIKQNGVARIVLSTGASQIDTLKYLVKMNVQWDKVELFHLDEYINLDENHPASFRKYLNDKFVGLLNLGKVNFVNPNGDIKKNIQDLTQEIRKAPIDLALIGIGENSHIAFNDPPADFDTTESFIIVELEEQCKRQQVREGWFNSIEDVPKQAITMSVFQIMQSKTIVSCVPYKAKANAIKMVLETEGVTNKIPATILKTHENITLFLDKDSASHINENTIQIQS